MTDETRLAVQKIATQLATLHGSAYAFSDPREGFMHTVASAAGYGRFANASSRYAENHWQKYRGAAEFVIEMMASKDLEIEALRRYGNKDCTAMADAALEQKRETGKVPWED